MYSEGRQGVIKCRKVGYFFDKVTFLRGEKKLSQNCEFPGKESVCRGEEARRATVGLANAEAGIAKITRP